MPSLASSSELSKSQVSTRIRELGNSPQLPGQARQWAGGAFAPGFPVLPACLAPEHRCTATPKAEPRGQPAELRKGYPTINAVNPKINTSVLPPGSGRLRDVKVSLC